MNRHEETEVVAESVVNELVQRLKRMSADDEGPTLTEVTVLDDHAGVRARLPELGGPPPRWLIVRIDADAVRAIEQRWDRELRQARDELFTRPIYERSPLGDCRRARGSVAADVVAMVLLSGLRLIGRGTPTVTELAGAVSLRHFHRYLAYVHQLVRDELSDQWVSVPDGETWLWFGLPVLPREDSLREFTGYLADDPIERDEIREYLSRCETLP